MTTYTTKRTVVRVWTANGLIEKSNRRLGERGCHQEVIDLEAEEAERIKKQRKKDALNRRMNSKEERKITK